MATILCLGSQDIRFPRRGGERSVRGSLQALAYSGHQVLYLYPASRVVECELVPGLRVMGVAATPKEGLRTLLRSFLYRLPYKFAKYYLAPVTAAAIAAGRRLKPDLLLVHGAHSGRSGLVVQSALGIPAILRAHNLEFEIVSGYAARLPLPLRFLARWQAGRTRRTEIALWRAYDKTCFISDADFHSARQLLGDSKKTACVYDGASFSSTAVPPPPPQTFLLSTSLDIPQNRVSLSWFLRVIWFPCMASGESMDARLTIIGPTSGELRKRLSLDMESLTAHHVQVKGFVQDFQHEVRQHAFFISPTILGSGYRVKIADAGAAGTCMLLTPIDERSLRFLQDGKNCLVFHDQESFAAIMRKYGQQPTARSRICQALQDDLRTCMDWEGHAHYLVKGLL